jgi:hypothetical protein
MKPCSGSGPTIVEPTWQTTVVGSVASRSRSHEASTIGGTDTWSG